MGKYWWLFFAGDESCLTWGSSPLSSATINKTLQGLYGHTTAFCWGSYSKACWINHVWAATVFTAHNYHGIFFPPLDPALEGKKMSTTCSQSQTCEKQLVPTGQWVVMGPGVGCVRVCVCYRQTEHFWSVVSETWIHPDSRYFEGEENLFAVFGDDAGRVL